MNLSILLLVSAALLSAQSTLDQTWTGLLIDDACRMANVTAKCGASGDTKSFGLEVSGGKYYKLDGAGNAKAQTALAARAKDAPAEVQAAVTGSIDGHTLKAASIELK